MEKKTKQFTRNCIIITINQKHLPSIDNSGYSIDHFRCTAELRVEYVTFITKQQLRWIAFIILLIQTGKGEEVMRFIEL